MRNFKSEIKFKNPAFIFRLIRIKEADRGKEITGVNKIFNFKTQTK